jgi:hypothetical protein
MMNYRMYREELLTFFFGRLAALLLDVPFVTSVKMKRLADPSGFLPYDCVTSRAGNVIVSEMLPVLLSSHTFSPPLDSPKPEAVVSSTTIT